MNRYLCVLVDGDLVRPRGTLWEGEVIQRIPHASFGLDTFFVNVTGSFLIGVLMTLFVERLRPPHNWQLVGVVGFLGGYTTCSSFEYDGYLAARGGYHWTALAYLVGSVVLRYAGVCLGAFWVTKQ